LNLYFGHCQDLTFRRLVVSPGAISGMVVYLTSVVDDQLLERSLDALQNPDGPAPPRGTADDALRWIERSQVTVPDTSEVLRVHQAALGIAAGKAVLFLQGATRALAFDVAGGPERAISESKTQRVVRGPREGFVESLNVNITLI